MTFMYQAQITPEDIEDVIISSVVPKLMYALTKPKYAIPIHGEYRHLKRHAELAVEMGIPKENVKILTTGDVLAVSENVFDVVGRVRVSPTPPEE